MLVETLLATVNMFAILWCWCSLFPDDTIAGNVGLRLLVGVTSTVATEGDW